MLEWHVYVVPKDLGDTFASFALEDDKLHNISFFKFSNLEKITLPILKKM